MPADSTTLAEEGAYIDGFLLVKGGLFDEVGIVRLLEAPAKMAPPPDKQDLLLKGCRCFSHTPHISHTSHSHSSHIAADILCFCRNLSDVLSDLKAQVGQMRKGISLHGPSPPLPR